MMVGRIALFGTLSLCVLAVCCSRREEERAETEPAGTTVAVVAAVEDFDVPSRSARPPGKRKAVIWLGLDGLDWELLDRLSREGKMPNWSRLVSEGNALD